MKKRVIASAVAAAIAGPVYADPPPNPDLPGVFCFRITDVERTLDTAGNTIDDSFLFEIEVLNWSRQDAVGLKMDLNEGTSDGVSIGNAWVDSDGRGGTTGTDADNPAYGELGKVGINEATPFHDGRGTVNHPNDWRVLNQSSTSAFFDAQVEFESGGSGGFDYGYGSGVSVGGTPLPNEDLLFGSGGKVPGTGLDTTGDSAVDGGPGPYTPGPDDGNPLVAGAPVNTPGEGNSLDGFVIQVDGLEEGETVSFNWALLDAAGGFYYGEQDIDCALMPTACFFEIGGGFGNGIASIQRMPPGGALGGPLFEGNSGFNQNPVTFFDNVFDLKNPAEFGAEFSGGQTGEFLEENDNVFGRGVNTPLAGTIPEPTTLALLGLGLGLAGWRRSRRY